MDQHHQGGTSRNAAANPMIGSSSRTPSTWSRTTTQCVKLLPCVIPPERQPHQRQQTSR